MAVKKALSHASFTILLHGFKLLTPISLSISLSVSLSSISSAAAFLHLHISNQRVILFTPISLLLLITPQNKLFTPHSFKQHSHPTLHTPHNPASIRFVPPNPSSPFFYLKIIREPQIRRFNKNLASSLHPPHPTPSSLCYPKPIRQPPNLEIRQKYQVSLLFIVFILAFSPLNIKKYEEVCIFFFEILSGFGFRILCYRILKSEVELLLWISLNPVRSYFLRFHDVRRK